MKDRVGFYASVGGRIRALRDGRGLTQQVLASRLDLTRSAVANIEKGRQQILAHTLVDIAMALDVTVPCLLPPLESTGDEQLEVLLQGRPRTQREWIESVVADRPASRISTQKKGR